MADTRNQADPVSTHDMTPPPIDTHGGPVAALPRMPGRVGDYELLEPIARGGMGVVYRAKQLSLNRIVALKMIVSGHFASEAMVRRFRAEAESAARLQHPHIVAVHEVGEHDGQPYFSMELVDGRSLAELVRDRPLASARAAAYVRSIAEAIHFAHERGILHRDLKPSNVLIDRDDRPRVTDFGLAKVVDAAARGDRSAAMTASGAVLGTPSYMSPEQAGGDTAAVGTASDVYALGAILYELVTGRPPFQADTPLETLLQVTHTEPARPALLNTAVDRDLETICLKCLEKEPWRRYATAAELAGDLNRFLAGEPIRARPASLWDRTIKWVKRRPSQAALVAVATAAALVLVAGTLKYNYDLQQQNLALEKSLGETRAQQLRAERNAEHALAAANTLVTELADSLRPLAGSRSETIERILDRSVSVVDDLLVDAGQSHQILAVRGRALLSAADLYLEFKSTEQGERSAGDALAIFEHLAEREPAQADWHARVADSLEYLGRARSLRGDLPGALEWFQSARAATERAIKAAPDRPLLRRDLAARTRELGAVAARQAQLDDAVAHYHEARDMLRELMNDESIREECEPEWWRVHLALGDARYYQADYAAAIELYNDALAIARSAAAQHPSHVKWQRNLMISHNFIAAVLAKQGDYAAAQQQYEASLAIVERMVREDPGNLLLLHDLALNHNELGDAKFYRGDRAGALAAYETARQTAERIIAQDASNIYGHRGRLRALDSIAYTLVELGRKDEALPIFESGLDSARQIAALDPTDSESQRNLALLHERVGTQYRHAGRLDDAAGMYRAGFEIIDRLVAASPDHADLRGMLASCHDNLGRLCRARDDRAGALHEFRAALEIRRRLAETDRTSTEARANLCVSYWNIFECLDTSRSDEKDQARQWLDAGLEILRELEQRGRLSQTEQGWLERFTAARDDLDDATP